MLDKWTLEWLEKREKTKIRGRYYFCAHCRMYNPWHYDKYRGYCMGDNVDCPLSFGRIDYKDSAEFEARAARCAAIGSSKLSISDIPFECVKKQSIQELALMAARLQVEQEMDRP